MRKITKLATRVGNKGTVVKKEPNTPIKVEQKTKISVSKIEQPSPLINILTRTSGRPLGFNRCRASIVNQTYKNIRHLVSFDSLADEEYVKASGAEYFFMDKVAISGELDIADPKTGGAFIYNRYLNHLIEKTESGWVLFLDDDDYLSDNFVIQKIVNTIKSNTDMILWQMKYPNGQVLPSLQELGKPPRMARIGAPCFMVHSGIAKTIKWDGWKCGDFRFIQKVWNKTVDKRVLKEVVVSLGGAGLGKRNDINANVMAKISNVENSGNGSEINGNMIINLLNKGKVVEELKAEVNKEYFDFIIISATYKRNDMLKQILDKINSQQTNYSYKIIILNDGNNIEEFNATFNTINNIEILHNEKNNGKYYYWKSVDKLLKAAKNFNFKYLIQLDDDHDPTEDFLNSAEDFFNENNTAKILKMVVNKDYDKKRWNLIDWVDGGSIYKKEVFDIIGYNIKEIPLTRWKNNNNLGSGVWQQVSERINKKNINVFIPKKSFANHLGYKDSIMNTELRKKEHLKTINFKK